MWFLKRLAAAGLMSVVLVCAKSSHAAAKSGLQVYIVDVEGGQATLFVTPAKQSLLIDTGWPENEGRDADRIVAAAKEAGIKRSTMCC